MDALTLLAADDNSASGGGAMSLVILLLIPLAMYFLLIRPQRKRMKSQQAMQSSLGVGDEVVTTGGIYGFITGDEDDLFWLEIDDDVQIRIAKAAIQGKVRPSDGAEEPNEPADTVVEPAGDDAD